MPSISRRDFLQDSALAAAALAGAGIAAEAHAEAAAAKKGQINDQLRVAVVGVHGRGKEHLPGFAGRNNCVITTICDADSAVIGDAMKYVENKQGKAPKFEQDIRKVVEDKDIDVVTIATPNHWHALAAIWALQNGKDVYVEKPVSHNVSEGRRIVETARKYNRICQTGTQSRSSTGMRAAMEYLHAGHLGKIKEPTPIPKSIDYDLWCGPAPNHPLMRESLHYDWHWQWDYGNGDLGNQGIHQMDLARWGLGVADIGRGVVSYGGRLGYEDAGETANTQVSIHDYGDKALIFEVRGLVTEPYKNAKVGVIFEGTEGYAVMGDYSGGAVFDLTGKMLWKFNEGGDHYGNFVKAVRSRKIEDLNGDILQGHLSSALCHLGNVSYRLGESLSVDEARQRLERTRLKDEALETFERVKHHLADNHVDLQSARIQFGANLTIDGKAETFMGGMSDRANPLLSREYRKGFEVPASAQLV